MKQLVDIRQTVDSAIKDFLLDKEVKFTQHLGGLIYVSVQTPFYSVDLRKFWIVPETDKLHATKIGINMTFDEYRCLLGCLSTLHPLWFEWKGTSHVYKHYVKKKNLKSYKKKNPYGGKKKPKKTKKRKKSPTGGKEKKKFSNFLVSRFYFLVFLLEVTPPCRGEKAYRAFELWTKRVPDVYFQSSLQCK